MVRLVVLGAHTELLTPLCARCPHSPAGCCISPPPVDWSDLGRIVSLGGRDWLLGELAAGRLVPTDFGARTKKARGRTGPDGPRVAKCVHHGPTGCTVPPSRRAATCNYYVCESAFDEGTRAELASDRATTERARRAHAALQSHYEALDAELGRRIRSQWPEPPAFDAPFLEALGAWFDELSADFALPIEGCAGDSTSTSAHASEPSDPASRSVR